MEVRIICEFVVFIIIDVILTTTIIKKKIAKRNGANGWNMYVNIWEPVWGYFTFDMNV